MPGSNSPTQRPTHPVELLACAIATQEGYFAAGTTPAVRNNPGDLRYAGQRDATCPRCHQSGNATPTCLGRNYHDVAVFGSRGTGIVGLYRQLWLQVASGQTVRQVIAQWAPPSDGNDTSGYLQNVLKWTGLPADIPVLNLLPDLLPLNR